MNDVLAMCFQSEQGSPQTPGVGQTVSDSETG